MNESEIDTLCTLMETRINELQIRISTMDELINELEKELKWTKQEKTFIDSDIAAMRRALLYVEGCKNEDEDEGS